MGKQKVPVTDFAGLADFCRSTHLDVRLGWKDKGKRWKLTILDGDQVLVKETLVGVPPKVLDDLALDAALSLFKCGRLG